MRWVRIVGSIRDRAGVPRNTMHGRRFVGIDVNLSDEFLLTKDGRKGTTPVSGIQLFEPELHYLGRTAGLSLFRSRSRSLRAACYCSATSDFGLRQVNP